jgi:LysM repeat protein
MNLKHIKGLILTAGVLLAVMAVLPTAFAQDGTATEDPSIMEEEAATEEAAAVTEEAAPVITEEAAETEEAIATEEAAATEEATITEAPTVAATSTPIPQSAAQTTASGTTYTIRPGDTLFNIARSFNVSVTELARVNNIVNPSRIFWGTTLVIPDANSEAPGTGGPATSTATATATTAPTVPDATTTYVVREGDNLYRISLRFNTSIARLQSLNSIDDANIIFIGQEIVVPVN